MARRLIVGNLDAELDFARLRRSGGPPREALPRKALDAAARFSTLMRAFAREGDELRTLAAVPPESLTDLPDLPRPRLSSGPASEVRKAGPVLAWAETAAVAAARSGRGGAGRRLSDAPLHELVWELPAPRPEAAAAANDRAFCLAAARELGLSLPGSRMIASLRELDSLPAPAAWVPAAWVVKAPFSAAGRSRFVHRGGPLAARARRTVERLLRRHGSLLFEPWMERTDDFGCAALVTAEETRIVGFHRLLVDRRGQFRGLVLRASFDGFFGLTRSEAGSLEATVDAVAARLRRAGYAGPFGIDCWRYRRGDGAVVFHPLGEINARMTFGLVGRALVDRIAGPLGLRREGHVRLGFAGSTPRSDKPADSGGQAAPCPSLVPLVRPGPGGRAVWLESVAESRSGATSLPLNTKDRR